MVAREWITRARIWMVRWRQLRHDMAVPLDATSSSTGGKAVSEAGKGSAPRPTNHEAFSTNFDAIDWGRRVAELIETTEELKLYPEQKEESQT